LPQLWDLRADDLKPGGGGKPISLGFTGFPLASLRPPVGFLPLQLISFYFTLFPGFGTFQWVTAARDPISALLAVTPSISRADLVCYRRQAWRWGVFCNEEPVALVSDFVKSFSSDRNSGERPISWQQGSDRRQPL